MGGQFENFTPPTLGSELTSAEITTLEELSALSNSSAGQFVRKENGSFVNSTLTETITLANLSDVATSSPTSGQVLSYNGSSWVNADASGNVGGSGTADQLVYWVDADTVGALTVVTYPSLTELSYVKGVTSEIQTQFTGKASTTLNNLGTTDINAALLFNADASYDIGSSTVGINDLHLGSGGVLNFDGGDVTLTHSADILTLGGGDFIVANGFGIVIGHTAQIVTATTDELQVLGTGGNDSSMTLGRFSADASQPQINFVKSRNATIGSSTIVQDNDALGGIHWHADDGTDFVNLAAQFFVEVDDASPAANDIGVAFVWRAERGGGAAIADVLRLSAAGALSPGVSDATALGTSSLMFSDLFLADGAVINFNAGNATITHSTSLLTFNTPVSLGTSNAITVGTIELGHASANTLSASGGILSIESVAIPTISSSDTLSNKTLTAPIVNAATITGNFNYSAVPTSDHTANGRTVSAFNLGATIAIMDLVYLGSASKWLLTDADAAATAGGVLIGICLDGGVDNDTTTVVLDGLVRDDTWNWTPGAPLYIDTATAGQLTATKPSGTDDVVRVVGFAVTADVIFLNPSPDYITIV